MVLPGAGMLGLVLIILGLLFVAQYYIWGRWIYTWAVKKEKQLEEEAIRRQPPRTESDNEARA